MWSTHQFENMEQSGTKERKLIGMIKKTNKHNIVFIQETWQKQPSRQMTIENEKCHENAKHATIEG